MQKKKENKKGGEKREKEKKKERKKGRKAKSSLVLCVPVCKTDAQPQEARSDRKHVPLT